MADGAPRRREIFGFPAVASGGAGESTPGGGGKSADGGTASAGVKAGAGIGSGAEIVTGIGAAVAAEAVVRNDGRLRDTFSFLDASGGLAGAATVGEGAGDTTSGFAAAFCVGAPTLAKGERVTP